MITKLAVSVAGLCCLSTALLADNLTFVAQPDPVTGLTNSSWFSPLNWFNTDADGNLIPANRVPGASESALVTGIADAAASGIRVQTLVLTNDACFTNGTVAMENLQMLSGSSLENATVNVFISMGVGGSNCAMGATILNVLSTASASFSPVAPATAVSLTLTQGTVFSAIGVVSLSDGSQIIGGGSPQSTLMIVSNSVLHSSGQCLVKGSSDGHLIIDNNGRIQASDGSLSFGDGIDWQSTFGLGEFNAAATNAQVLFSGAFQVQSGVTSLFTGPGTNRFAAGGTIDGIAQVGNIDRNTLAFIPGNLEVADSMDGGGILHVLGNQPMAGVLTWKGGTFSLVEVDIDPGGQLLLAGAPGTSRQLSDCLLNNSGLCQLLSGDLMINPGGAVNNLAGATFELDGDAIVSQGAGTGTGLFNNAGIFRKTSPGTSQFGAGNLPAPDFNNTGLVDLLTGQLNLSGGTSSGEFRTAPGTVLWFWGGTHTLNAGASLTGGGSVRLAQGAAAATLDVNGAVTSSELEVSSNGLLVGPGPDNANVFQVGTLIVSDNGSISNGTLQLQNLQMLDQGNFSGSGVSVATSLTMTGTNCSLNGATLTLLPSALATFRPVAPSSAVVLSLNQGAVINNLAGATCDLQGDGIVVGSPGPGGGVVNNAGTLLKSAGTGGSSISCAFTNSGLLHLAGGTLNFEGSWTQTGGSTVVEIEGTGSGTQSDHLAITGPANLGGQLELHFPNGFLPKPGDQFQILTCASQTGSFQGITAPQIAGATWLTQYNGTNVTLTLTHEAIIGSPTISGGSFSFPVQTVAGLVYLVQRSDSLSPANWQTLKTINGLGSYVTVTDPVNQGQRFYRVINQ